jgi:hydroxymethylglutaryl-CoA lyase
MSWKAELPRSVRLVEVGPRDGLQNEAASLDLQTKVRLIDLLSQAGFSTIEAGSFVSPRWVPQMADTGSVLRSIERRRGTSYPVLVPNLKGLALAREAGATEIAVFAAASETFSQKNINCSIDESLERLGEVAAEAVKHHLKVRGYVSCVWGCPYEGEVSPEAVLRVSKALLAMGCYEISLGDTIGVGTPGRVQDTLALVSGEVPRNCVAVHFHDTWGQGLANILSALLFGIQVIDSSIAGLGGCPYAKGATGNVATEDVLYMLQGMGIQTGIDLEKAAAAGHFICDRLDKTPASKVAIALSARCSPGLKG